MAADLSPIRAAVDRAKDVMRRAKETILRLRSEDQSQEVAAVVDDLDLASQDLDTEADDAA